MSTNLAILGRRQTALHLKARLELGKDDRSIVRIGRYLAEHDRRMVLVSGGGSGVALAEANNIVCEALNLDRPSLIGGWRKRGRLAEQIAKFQASLVHCHDTKCLEAAHNAVPDGTPLVLSFSEGSTVLTPAIQKTIKNCQRVIVSTHFEADRLIDQDIVPNGKIRVLHDTVDEREFDPATIKGHRVSALANRWNIDAGSKVVLIIAPIEEGFGHLLMIDALAQMQRSDLQLLLIGDHTAHQPFVKAVESHAAERGLDRQVRFVSECEDMPAAIMLADICAFLNDKPFPLPRVTLEAQALGKPVIMSGVGAAHEMMMPAATGWLLEEMTTDELAWATGLALDLQEDVRDRLAGRARDFVQSEFAINKVGERLVAVYGELERSQ